MNAALPKVAEAAPHGMVRIYNRRGSMLLTVERALPILRSRRRMRDPTAPALAEAIAASLALRQPPGGSATKLEASGA